MNLRLILFVLLLSFAQTLQAQTGNYFLSNYAPTDERIDFLTFGMAQDDRGVIYFANKSGVLEFDGRNWTPITAPGPVYTIVTSTNGVFVGGLKGYGKITISPEGNRIYRSLSDAQPAAKEIIFSIAVKEKIYFLTEHTLFIVSATTGATEQVIKAGVGDSFTGIYEIIGNVYVGSEIQGLLKIRNEKLERAKFSLPENLTILFCNSLHGSDKVVVGSANNRIFVYDAIGGLKEVKLKDENFLESNVMVSGVWVNENLLAIGTLRGGVLFINPFTGAVEEIVNYLTGLPDNEVYTILTDRNQGVWVSHDYGFTRIAPFLPFRSYSHYPGLSGNLLCARNFNNQIYVGTTLGLFNLVRQEVYENEQYDVKVKPKGGGSKSSGGFFSFFKRDKSKSTPKADAKGKATRRVLKSLQYVYKKVEGVDGKVSQLTEADGKMLASGITGVLEINGLKSKVITNVPVRTVFLSSALHQLLISTLDQEVKSFLLGPKGWSETGLLDTLREDFNYIFEDKLQNIWLCGRTHVFKVETVDKKITDISNIPFNNPSLDEPVGVAYGSEIYVAASGAINKYDISKNKFTAFSSLSESKKYFASAGYFWFYNGHYWSTVDDKMEDDLKLKWLGLFQNIRFLAPVGHGEGMWIITAANELYKFSSNKVVTENDNYPLFLREVKGQQSKIAPAQSVKVNQLESTVAFDFIQPNYFGNAAVEYRYRVNGLAEAWTEFEPTNNIVNFPYLPIGTYKVEVQTRNLLGKESSPQEIMVEVIPPYWKQSWFYAMEVAFFGLLVFVSIRLSSANSKYRYLSGLLSVLTIIMLIQFIQTIAASWITIKSSPVVDFFVQVCIALLVLPLEGYLRKVMTRQAQKA